MYQGAFLHSLLIGTIFSRTTSWPQSQRFYNFPNTDKNKASFSMQIIIFFGDDDKLKKVLVTAKFS